MFSRTAEFYDLIYSFKDYERESEKVARLIRSHNPGAQTLLDVACGTGKHLAYLKQHFQCEGLDLDTELLAIARNRLPAMPLHHGNMLDFDLGRTFDAVTCLFSAIGYAGTEPALRSAVSCMARHLCPCGVLLVEPWIDPEQFQDGYVHLLTVEGDGLNVARMSRSRKDGSLAVVDFHYLIGSKAGVRHETESHSLALFSRQQYLDAFQQAGLQAEYDPEGLMGRGLYAGVKL